MNLKDLLDESCVLMDRPLQKKQEVFTELSESLHQAGIVDDIQEFIKAVEYRETLSETGLEDGIAIPHGIDGTVRQAALAYMRLQEPIPWESMDGQPVRHVFLMAIPANGDKIHIRMLSELAMKLVRKEARTALNTVRTKEELYKVL